MKNRIISLLLTLSIVLPGTLSAASLLSPAPARAAGRATEHYSFVATTTNWEQNHTQLKTNLIWNNAGLRTSTLGVYTGTMYLPTGGTQNAPSFYMVNSAGTKTYNESTGAYVSLPYGSPLHQNSECHFGLPYEVRNNGDIYYTAPTESLEITLQNLKSLDTTGLAAANVSMVIAQVPTVAGLNIPQDRRLEVRVSLDGETWLDGSAGVRSATLIAGGLSGGKEAQFFQIETDNLLDIPGVKGATIQGIKILPEGEDVCSQGGLRITKLLVNTYETETDFNELSPAEDITYTTATDSLRNVTVAEALRTAAQAWTSAVAIDIFTPSGSSFAEDGATAESSYAANTEYLGPVYERTSDSSRELFQSLLADGNYSAEEAKLAQSPRTVNSVTKYYPHPYGMDCQTFVFNAISRVSRTNAWAVAYTPWATRAKLVDGLNPLPYPVYTDNDIVTPTVNEKGVQAVYQHYRNAQVGDIAIHYQSNSNNSVHTRLVTEVYVKEKSDGSIDPDNSYMRFTEQTNSIMYAYKSKWYGNTIHYNTSKPSSAIYQVLSRSSSRTGVEMTHSFSSLLSEGYVVYTLDEYEENKVEDVNVEAVATSKTADTSFVDGGVTIAVSSNYRIIKRHVTLKTADSNKVLFDSRTDDPDFPEYYIAENFIPTAFNYSDDTLDSLLKNLPSGKYTLTVSVASGPFTNKTDENAPTTDIPFEFTVDGDDFCDGGSHESKYGWTELNEAWFENHTLSNDGFYTLSGGKYYLTDDLTVPGNSRLSLSKNVMLCLNGHDLMLLPQSSNVGINVGTNAHLTLCDCAGTGTIQAGNSVNNPGTDGKGLYALHLNPRSQVDMYGGSITNTYARFGSVYVKDAALNMYGGSISGNTSPNYSGINLIGSSTFNMYDGIISNNSGSTNASGINIFNDSTANIYSGTITGCSSPISVYVCDDGSTLNMSGGSITGNTSTQYDAVYVANGTFTMTGGSIFNNVVPIGKKQVGIDEETGTFVQTGGTIIEYMPYSIDVTDAANGTVSVDKTGGQQGETVTVTATPNQGYYLRTIRVDGVAIEGNTFTISGNHTVTATFAKLTKFYGSNIDLGSTLDMNFYYAKNYVTTEGCYAKLVRTYTDGREDDVQTLSLDELPLNGAYYQITYGGLAAKEMCDEISVTIYNSADMAISETYTQSMRSYVMRALDHNSDSVFRTALVDMLNYGAAAQVNFNYSTGDLANNQLTEQLRAEATQSVSCENVQVKTEHVHGSNLDLESRILLNFYFTNVTSGMYAEVSYTNHLEETESYRVEYEDFVSNGNTHLVCVDMLAIADGNTLVTCTVYNADGSQHASATDSMNSYLARALEADASHAWMEYIAKFSASAYNYLHNN